ncbi:uncharacterized protein TRUGW13939_10571 [Talaromyces rugulosus]|uniref:Ribosomal protein S17 n=1 Tax=Talaromyces rugulosus TaxID=121627 RepID=A0A7H8RC99_TALRU|nr:uncharacterized protein TRUGW13939_10571 [Talaromyces rugulosus]QKX63401.1 hypothetical protein TRUGW13939_10571 [Talaromyces rugulosus]
MPPTNVLRSLWLSRSSVFSSTVPTATTRRTTRYVSGGSRFTLPHRTLTTTRPSLAEVKSTTTQGTPKETETSSEKKQQQQQEEANKRKYAFPSGITMPKPRQYPYDVKTGTVTSVGLMDKTVRVQYRHRKWEPHIQKYYPHVTTYLVSDPQGSLREGDVIEFSSGARRSPRVRHVVDRIVAPFGVGIDERPAVLTREQREQQQTEKRQAKVARKLARVVDEAVERNGGQPVDEADLETLKRHFLLRQFQDGKIKRLVRKRLQVEAAEESK